MSDMPERIRKQHAEYLAMAEEADRMAAAARNMVAKVGWEHLAESYRTLAKELTFGRW